MFLQFNFIKIVMDCSMCFYLASHNLWGELFLQSPILGLSQNMGLCRVWHPIYIYLLKIPKEKFQCIVRTGILCRFLLNHRSVLLLLMPKQNTTKWVSLWIDIETFTYHCSGGWEIYDKDPWKIPCLPQPSNGCGQWRRWGQWGSQTDKQRQSDKEKEKEKESL